jgi:hypothetical protein
MFFGHGACVLVLAQTSEFRVSEMIDLRFIRADWLSVHKEVQYKS